LLAFLRFVGTSFSRIMLARAYNPSAPRRNH
jgi:hypothetical protein